MSTITIYPEETALFRKVTCDCNGADNCNNLLCWQHSSRYLAGIDKPNHPLPAKIDIPVSLISWLWVYMPRTKRNRKALNQWFVTLCFNKAGHYTG